MSDQCHSCGAPILWAYTRTGKPIPINPEPSEHGNISVYELAGILRATVVKPAIAQAMRDDGRTLYLTHFVDCTDAKNWRHR